MLTDKVIGFKLEKQEGFISNEDAILYSLGIGFSEDPTKKADLDFTYEFADNFQCFPTSLGAYGLEYNAKLIQSHPYIPDFNMMSLLHGEQWTEVVKPFQPGMKIFYDAELADFEDKGSGTVFLVANTFWDEEGSIILRSKSVLFVRDIKGHKYKSTGILRQISIPGKAPQTNPDKIVSVPTKKNQAILYRIGGKDPNPLHVDENMAKMGGFDTPILHGMCFYGMTCKAVFESICPDDISNVLSFNARFTSHVFPGETLEVFIWGKDSGKLLVTARTQERKKQVLIGEVEIKKSKF
eukprot:CAMPEP_0170523996 /NCGR_PEP_ID=MMETSP0209-20121228/9448_1 /TAXON_ID=665100 ORGANISM="Litonotus pictus, Strain P1" /NCGR_SAMPLE_ID=MMETSP0209 /ASSEMBLY_ACC=CAM_ASM_000301 /LENGTH=295 /DNA_ID=CAMNT_0010812453 /DNA_START=19 /DNA_END=906 /DNA_ORIENTATION=-